MFHFQETYEHPHKHMHRITCVYIPRQSPPPPLSPTPSFTKSISFVTLPPLFPPTGTFILPPPLSPPASPSCCHPSGITAASTKTYTSREGWSSWRGSYCSKNSIHIQGVSEKLCFSESSATHPLFYISLQETFEVLKECTVTPIGWPFFVQPIAAHCWRSRGRKVLKILGKTRFFF